MDQVIVIKMQSTDVILVRFKVKNQQFAQLCFI